MIVSLIVAMDERRGIGKENRLPWRLSSDLKRFKALTMGHHIIVGRKTFESIGRPLPGRVMIVVTRDRKFKPDDCLIARSIEEALALARERGESEVFVCGGAEIYKQSLEKADRLYLTLVHAEAAADTFFPAWYEEQWIEKESSHNSADEKNEYASTFKLLVKRDEGR